MRPTDPPSPLRGHGATSQTLVERARDGDAVAIGELFSRYWRAARAAAFGVTGDFASAEDAAADAFREAWAGLNGLRDGERFGPWLRTIVIRKARLIRRRDHSIDRDGEALERLADAADSPDRALQRAEQDALVHTLVRQLPPRLRETVSLFYFEGYETEEAATFLDIPPGTVRRRLHEARRQLRAAIEDTLGRKEHPMNKLREEEIERLKGLMDAADKGDAAAAFHLFRGAFALRPVPSELMAGFAERNHAALEQLGAAAARLTNPSSRASDPAHPIAIVADRIRRALLPDLPVRATRGVMVKRDDGATRTTYELLRDSPDPDAFRTGMAGARLSDVLDVTWRAAGPLELRTVQDLLERVSTTVLPNSAIRFAPHDEPRYRVALRLLLGNDERPAVIAGVLAEGAGQQAGQDSAYLRFFLEPWASAHAGQAIDFDAAPGGGPPI